MWYRVAGRWPTREVSVAGGSGGRQPPGGGINTTVWGARTDRRPRRVAVHTLYLDRRKTWVCLFIKFWGCNIKAV